MSGRPADPSYTVDAFAPDTNYPAGSESWNSNPTKVAPPGAASVGLTPDQPLPAQYLNYLHYRRYVEGENAKTKLSELYTYLARSPRLNWDRRQIGANYNAAAYAEGTRQWITVADNEEVRESGDWGHNWSASSVVAAAGAGENCKSIAVDPSGNVVVGTSNGYVFTKNATTGAWAKVATIAGSSVQIVAYDAASGLWVTLCDGGASAVIKTSPDRATWTSRTPPTEWSDWTTYPAMGNLVIASNGAGRHVVVGQGYNALGPVGAGLLRVMTSDDGGATWTDRGTLATTIVSPTVGHLSYNATTGHWLYSVGEVSGTPTGEVWRSSDGVTWTKIKTFANAALRGFAPDGVSWLGLARSGSSELALVASDDDGVSWKFLGVSLAGSNAKGVYAGGGGFLALSDTNVYFNVRAEDPSLGSLA